MQGKTVYIIQLLALIYSRLACIDAKCFIVGIPDRRLSGVGVLVDLHITIDTLAKRAQGGGATCHRLQFIADRGQVMFSSRTVATHRLTIADANGFMKLPGKYQRLGIGSKVAA